MNYIFMSMYKRIFLWGMMGVGKSSMGKQLAEKLDIPFIDLDESISKVEGMSIPEIFQERGESFFRELEHDTLQKIIRENQTFILSTGGGTPCFYDNSQMMNKAGLTIYLEIEISILVSRLVEQPGKRPLLQSIEDLQVLGHVNQLIENRRIFYDQAQLKLSLTGNFDQDIKMIQHNVLKQ